MYSFGMFARRTVVEWLRKNSRKHMKGFSISIQSYLKKRGVAWRQSRSSRDSIKPSHCKCTKWIYNTNGHDIRSFDNGQKNNYAIYTNFPFRRRCVLMQWTDEMLQLSINTSLLLQVMFCRRGASPFFVYSISKNKLRELGHTRKGSIYTLFLEPIFLLLLSLSSSICHRKTFPPTSRQHTDRCSNLSISQTTRTYLFSV